MMEIAGWITFGYLCLGLTLYCFDVFDEDTDVKYFNNRDAITYTLLGGLIWVKMIIVATRSVTFGGLPLPKVGGIICHIRYTFRRNFKD